MGGPYENLDEKMKQLPTGTIYGIYTEVLRAMKEKGIRAEENDTTIIIDIGKPEDEKYMRLHYDKVTNTANVHYRVSGELAKELVRGIGQHFPILEGLDKLVENVRYVDVWTRIENERKKCENGRESCKRVSVDIKIIGKPYSNSKQDGVQLQPPTELGEILAQSSLEQLINLTANGNIRVFKSPDKDEIIHVTPKNSEESIFGYYSAHGMGFHSYTVSGESAKKIMKEVGKYIPLPSELKEAENIRITWKFTRFGYVLGFHTESNK